MPTFPGTNTRQELILRRYDRTYSQVVKKLAAGFGDRKVIPKHFFYKLVIQGPETELEVSQIADSLDHLANTLANA